MSWKSFWQNVQINLDLSWFGLGLGRTLQRTERYTMVLKQQSIQVLLLVTSSIRASLGKEVSTSMFMDSRANTAISRSRPVMDECATEIPRELVHVSTCKLLWAS